MFTSAQALRRVACLLALLAFPLGLLTASPASAVTNGVVVATPASVVPWVLSLEYGKVGDGSDARSICTASAVGPIEIVTASHCVKGPGFFFVRVGATTLHDGELIPVEAIRDNTGYNARTFANDLAVLRPAVELTLRSYARLAPLALETKVRSARPPALTLYGWGLNERGKVTGRLNAATLRPQASEAKQAYGSGFNPKLTIAAGFYNADRHRYVAACNGDSGGPLVVRSGRTPYLVGVVSFGKAGCRPAPTVFTSVGNYAAWLAAAPRALAALSRTKNLALPVVRQLPTLVGTEAIGVGTTLTCTQGTWSANAKSFSMSWYEPAVQDAPVATGPTYTVRAGDGGRVLYCGVSAVSRRGTALAAVKVALPPAPEPFIAPRAAAVNGVGTAGPLPTGSSASCDVPAFTAPNVVLTYAWFGSASATDPTGGTPLGSGQILPVTPAIQAATLGRYLLCQVTASNPMGSVVGAAARFVAAA